MVRDLAPRPRPRARKSRVDLICLSHLRWDFVFQRPQHLLSRCARQRRVFFVEEPVTGADFPAMELRETQPGVKVAVPHLPRGLEEEQRESILRRLLGEMLRRCSISEYALWYCTPMALPFTRHLTPQAVVYDCMDELSAFAGAHPSLARHEAELLRRCQVVLTGGHSLYEAKRHRHPNVHALPSSVDVEHFSRARKALREPEDQATLPRPRLGYFGVIDERMDLSLVAGLATARPDYQIVMLGPVVKIDPARLPRLPNVHWLGKKAYDDLPAYLAGWDVTLIPFAKNEATRFISPTKTPEYLAANKRVVSTSIRDVVQPYGEMGLVEIADTTEEMIAAVDACVAEERGPSAPHLRAMRRARIDAFLARSSWDGAWATAEALLEEALSARRARLGGA